MHINKISFTGSVFAGNKLQELSAKSNLKRVVLELGGKLPSLIFSDANFDNAIQHHSQRFLLNTGQACVAASQTFVEESIAPKFIEESLKKRYEELAHAKGNSADSKIYWRHMVDAKQFERVISFLEMRKSEAELVTRGTRRGEKGCCFYPTIFLNPKNDARIYREEIFDPVVFICTFKTEEEAIKLANFVPTPQGMELYGSKSVQVMAE
ncbi:hypothetical protein PMIN06_005168 [Paraphaeosphaeria minitans]